MGCPKRGAKSLVNREVQIPDMRAPAVCFVYMTAPMLPQTSEQIASQSAWNRPELWLEGWARGEGSLMSVKTRWIDDLRVYGATHNRDKDGGSSSAEKPGTRQS